MPDFSTNSPRGHKVRLATCYCNYRTNNSDMYVIECLYKHAGFIDVIVFSILIVTYIYLY